MKLKLIELHKNDIYYNRQDLVKIGEIFTGEIEDTWTKSNGDIAGYSSAYIYDSSGQQIVFHAAKFEVIEE